MWQLLALVSKVFRLKFQWLAEYFKLISYIYIYIFRNPGNFHPKIKRVDYFCSQWRVKTLPLEEFCVVRNIPLHFCNFFFNLLGLWDLGVRVLDKNGYSTSLCLAHETSIFKISIKNHLDSIFFWSGGSWQKSLKSFGFCTDHIVNRVWRHKKWDFSKLPCSD